jgi:hypothetical protein
LCICDNHKLVEELVGVTRKQSLKHSDLVCCTVIIETEENNAFVWVSLSIYLLTEIFIICNDNPIFCERFLHHSIVRYSSRFVIHRENIMMLRAKPARYSRTSAFVNREAHLRWHLGEWHKRGSTKRFRREQEAGLNILVRQTVIFVQDLLNG